MKAPVAVVPVGDRGADVALDALVAAGAEAIELDEAAGVALGLFPPSADDVAVRVREALLARGLDVRVDVREAELADWGSVWRAAVRPVRVGPLVVVAEGAAVPGLGGGDRVLSLEVGTAFGTGLHPTTALCLERLVERPPRGRVLDVGTGTGILALAALALGASGAVGTDVDREALDVARRNAVRNGYGDVLRLSEAMPGERFELVLANVLAGPVADLAGELLARCGPGAELSLSGFTSAQAETVERAYRHRGARILARAQRAGWCRVDLAVPW